MQSLPAALGRRLQAILGPEGVAASVDELARLRQAKGELTDPARLVSDRPTPHEVVWDGRRVWTHGMRDAPILPFVGRQMADIRSAEDNVMLGLLLVAALTLWQTKGSGERVDT